MPEEGKANPNPQGLDAGSQEFEELEIELSDEDREELSKIDWSGDSAVEEENTASEPEDEATPDVEQEDTVEYELPEGGKLTLGQLQELQGYEKRYKDLQADYTRKAQENTELRQHMLAAQYMQPQYQPQPFQHAPMETPYATETERELAERLAKVEQVQAQRDYQEWQQRQREAVRRSNELVDSFRAKHNDLSDDQVGEVLAKANQAGTYDLELVYRGMHDWNSEIAEAEKRGKEKFIAEFRKKQDAKLEPSAQPSKPPKKIDVRTLTEEQRHALMVNDLIEGG